MPDSFTISERFPYAQFHPEWSLVTWHPMGVLDNERADQVVEYLEQEEKPDVRPFHRYTDMTGYSRIRIGLDHIVRIALRRKRYAGPPVKSAFYAVRAVSVGVARMFEELMHGSKIQVCTFRDCAAAAHWLGVPATLLKPPKLGA